MTINVQPAEAHPGQVYDPIKNQWFSVTDKAILDEGRARLWKRRNFHHGRIVRDGRVLYDGRWWTSPELEAYPGSRVYLFRHGLEVIRQGSKLRCRMPFLDEYLYFTGFVYEQWPQ